MMEHNDIQRSSKNNSRKEQGVSNRIQVYDPKLFWKDRKIVSLDQWFQIKENCALKAAGMQ